jgi:uncharacterized membrane protein (DUF2068 family)
LAYAAIRLAEGYGLWLGKHWAEWLAVISAGLYLPFEISHFNRHPSNTRLSILTLFSGLANIGL